MRQIKVLLLLSILTTRVCCAQISYDEFRSGEWLDFTNMFAEDWKFYSVDNIGIGDWIKYYPSGETYDNWSKEVTIIRFYDTPIAQLKSSQKQMAEAIKLRNPETVCTDLSKDSADEKSLILLVENAKHPDKENRTSSLIFYREGIKNLFSVQITIVNEKFPQNQLKTWIKVIKSMKFKDGLELNKIAIPNSFSHYFSQFQTNLMLVKKSTGIDEFPIWLPGGNKIAYCNMGKYYSLDLNTVHAVTGKWGDRKIAAIDIANIKEIDQDKFEELKKNISFNPKDCSVENYGTIRIKIDVMSTEMVLKRENGTEVMLLKSGGEIYHSPMPSPDGKYITFIAEMTGLMVMKLK